jgi:hypothetical protein
VTRTPPKLIFPSTRAQHSRTALALSLKKAAERTQVHRRHWQKIEAAEVNTTMATEVFVKAIEAASGGRLHPHLQESTVRTVMKRGTTTSEASKTRRRRSTIPAEKSFIWDQTET